MRRFEQGVLDYGEVNRVVAHRHVGQSRAWVSLAHCTPNRQGRVLPGFDDLVIGVFEAEGPFEMVRDRGAGKERLWIRRGLLYAIPWDCPRFVSWTGSYRFPSVALPRAWVERFLGGVIDDLPRRLGTLAHLVAEDAQVAALLSRLARETPAREPDELDDLHADQAMGLILTSLLLRVGLREPRPEALPPWRLRRVFTLVEERLGERLTLDDLAGAAGLSRFHFGRAFRESTGQTPIGFLQERRLERARDLLRTTRLPLEEVARRAGFGSVSRFGEAFRRGTGTTPARWRAGGG